MRRLAKKRGISPFIAVIILISLVISCGLLLHAFVFPLFQAMMSRANFSVEDVSLMIQTDGTAAFTVTVKNTAAHTLKSLTINLAGKEYTVLSNGDLKPGASSSYVVFDPDPPIEGFVSGNSYLVVVTAEFSDGSSAAKTELVTCLGAGSTETRREESATALEGVYYVVSCSGKGVMKYPDELMAPKLSFIEAFTIHPNGTFYVAYGNDEYAAFIIAKAEPGASEWTVIDTINMEIDGAEFANYIDLDISPNGTLFLGCSNFDLDTFTTNFYFKYYLPDGTESDLIPIYRNAEDMNDITVRTWANGDAWILIGHKYWYNFNMQSLSLEPTQYSFAPGFDVRDAIVDSNNVMHIVATNSTDLCYRQFSRSGVFLTDIEPITVDHTAAIPWDVFVASEEFVYRYVTDVDLCLDPEGNPMVAFGASTMLRRFSPDWILDFSKRVSGSWTIPEHLATGDGDSIGVSDVNIAIDWSGSDSAVIIYTMHDSSTNERWLCSFTSNDGGDSWSGPHLISYGWGGAEPDDYIPGVYSG